MTRTICATLLTSLSLYATNLAQSPTSTLSMATSGITNARDDFNYYANPALIDTSKSDFFSFRWLSQSSLKGLNHVVGGMVALSDYDNAQNIADLLIEDAKHLGHFQNAVENVANDLKNTLETQFGDNPLSGFTNLQGNNTPKDRLSLQKTLEWIGQLNQYSIDNEQNFAFTTGAKNLVLGVNVGIYQSMRFANIKQPRLVFEADDIFVEIDPYKDQYKQITSNEYNQAFKVEDLQNSKIHYSLLTTVQFPLGYARSIEIQGHTIRLGATGSAIAATSLAHDFDENTKEDVINEKIQTQITPDLDLGVLYRYGNWNVAIAFKHLLAPKLSTKYNFDLDRQIKIGGSYNLSWWNVQTQLDLMSYKTPLTKQEQQLFGVGTQLHYGDWISIRGGVNINMAGEKGTAYDFGANLWFVDLGATIKEDDQVLRIGIDL